MSTKDFHFHLKSVIIMSYCDAYIRSGTMRLRILRRLEDYEYDVLPIFMYNAIPQDDEDELLDIDVVKSDTYTKYIKDFGKEDDYALVWEIDGLIAGLAWVRMFEEADHSFGFVCPETPELTLSVLAGYNEQAIGQELLELISNELKLKGYDNLSVSVSNDNEILDVYEKVGFIEKQKQEDDRILLVKQLN